MTVTGDEPLVGHTLDQRYVIGQLIARGGMASVYKATDTRLERTVAVKVMHSGLGDPDEFRERFEREAKAAARLNHPNVVAVFDQGNDGDLSYLVMEYVEGHTLRDVIRAEAPMPPERALELLTPVLVALSEAHGAGIVHRDIKPENVLISTSGEVKVADFGLARAVSAATTHTRGALIGTVSYLAPEVVTNSGSNARADVYSCGAVLYEMLTGAKPHVAETPIQVAYMHVNNDIAAPSLLSPGLPDYVDALVARATSRDPQRRSPDAWALLTQVRQVRNNLAAHVASDADLTMDLTPLRTEPDPIVPRTASDFATATQVIAPAAPVEPPPPRKRSHRGLVLFLVALLLLAAVAGFGWWMGVGRYDPTPKLTDLALTSATSTAKQKGLEVKVTRHEYSETIAKDHVISTSPQAGERILHGGTIDIVLSMGKERYAVPDLVGKSTDEATALLVAQHLALGTVTRAWDEQVAKGSIIKMTNATPGDEVKRDTTIDVVVSRGRKPIKIIDYTGKAADAAAQALSAAGFTVKTDEQFSADVDKGKVISQTPATGNGFKSDTITLVVSKGPEQVQVPDIGGMTQDQAAAALSAVGLQFSPSVSGIVIGQPTVHLQTPSAGATVDKGSTVRALLY